MLHIDYTTFIERNKDIFEIFSSILSLALIKFLFYDIIHNNTAEMDVF